MSVRSLSYEAPTIVIWSSTTSHIPMSFKRSRVIQAGFFQCCSPAMGNALYHCHQIKPSRLGKTPNEFTHSTNIRTRKGKSRHHQKKLCNLKLIQNITIFHKITTHYELIDLAKTALSEIVTWDKTAGQNLTKKFQPNRCCPTAHDHEGEQKPKQSTDS